MSAPTRKHPPRPGETSLPGSNRFPPAGRREPDAREDGREGTRPGEKAQVFCERCGEHPAAHLVVGEAEGAAVSVCAACRKVRSFPRFLWRRRPPRRRGGRRPLRGGWR